MLMRFCECECWCVCAASVRALGECCRGPGSGLRAGGGSSCRAAASQPGGRRPHFPGCGSASANEQGGDSHPSPGPGTGPHQLSHGASLSASCLKRPASPKAVTATGAARRALRRADAAIPGLLWGGPAPCVFALGPRGPPVPAPLACPVARCALCLRGCPRPRAPPQHPPRASAAGGGPGAEQRRVSLQAFPGQWGEESHTCVLRLQGRTPSGLGRVDADDSVSGGPKGGQDVGASGKLLCRQVSRVSVLASVRAGAGASAGLGVSRAGEAGLVGPSGCVDRGPGAGVSGAGHGRPDGAGEVESMLFTRLRLRAKRACFALSTVHVSATFLHSFLEIIQKHQED